MKRFIDEIEVHEPELVRDIVKSLEAMTGSRYEIELYESNVCPVNTIGSLTATVPNEKPVFRLKIFMVELFC